MKFHSSDLKRAEEFLANNNIIPSVTPYPCCPEGARYEKETGACANDHPGDHTAPSPYAEALAAEFCAIRQETRVNCNPAECNHCKRKCYFGERIKEGDKVYCDYDCAEMEGEPWAEK